MEGVIYLRVGVKHWYGGRYRLGTVAAFKKNPTTKSNEIAIKLRLCIPDSIFTKPTLNATIEVPDVSTEDTITPEICDSVAQALTDQLGMKVEVTVPPEESSND